MKTSLLSSLLAATALSTLPFASLHAAADATDNANNATYGGGTFDGLNGGTGFGVNTLSNNGNTNYGSFIGSAADNAGGNTGGAINTNGKSFAIYAYSGGLIQNTRSFTTGGSNASVNLATNQTFSLGLDNGYVSTGSTVGFNLLNPGGTSQFTFQFMGGNTNYTYSIGTGAQIDTGVPYTASGLNISYAKGAGNAFTLTISPIGGATVAIPGTMTAGATISQFQVFNNNATANDTANGQNYNLYFNNPAVTTVPEPGTWFASLAGIGLLAGVQRFRRNRRA